MKFGESLWFDGAIKHLNDKIPLKYLLACHALHYGTAAFEGIRFYKTPSGPVVFRLQEHLERLFHSAAAISIKIPYSAEYLTGVIKNLIWLNMTEEGYIRPIVFYGYGKMGVNPLGYRQKGSKAEVNCAILTWDFGSYLGDDNIKLKISPFRRNHPQSAVMSAKLSGAYLNSALAVMDASSSGFDEALLLDWKGRVAEGSGENIFIVNKRGQLQTTPPETILPGITRDTVMTIAKDKNIPVVERYFYQNALKTAKEVFLCGTAVEITPVVFVDNCPIGNGGAGPITTAIKERFLQIARGGDERYLPWLTFTK